MKQYVYEVCGAPVPLARPRFAPGSARVFDAQKEIKYIIGISLRSQHKDEIILNPLGVNFIFQMPWYETSRVPHNAWYAKTPDIDNLIKMYLDIAQGIIFQDDKQIVNVCASKIWNKEPKTIITLKEISEKGKPIHFPQNACNCFNKNESK